MTDKFTQTHHRCCAEAGRYLNKIRHDEWVLDHPQVRNFVPIRFCPWCSSILTRPVDQSNDRQPVGPGA